MWLLIALFSAWCAMAAIEHAWWMTVEAAEDLAVAISYRRQTVANIQVLQLLDQMTNMVELIYDATVEAGVEYPDLTRHSIAQAIGEGRKMVASRVGPNPFYHDHHPQGRWPFDAEGQVKP